jgi:hypothetical protein
VIGGIDAHFHLRLIASDDAEERFSAATDWFSKARERWSVRVRKTRAPSRG